MFSFSRSFIKSSQCVFTSAIRKISQTYIPVSSITKNITRSTLLKPISSRCALLNSSNRLPSISNVHIRNTHHQTDGDKDLLSFLKEEITYEEQNTKDVPKYKDFKMAMNGTVVTLTKNHNGEKVQVTFDCNDNINVDDNEAMHEEDLPDDEDEDVSDIVSYPTFTVTLAKPSGNTILFNCNCNTGINEEDEEMDGDADEEQYDILRFDSVQIYNEKTDDKDTVYVAESENMDGELYSMLMNTLLERGINGTFVNDLIELSTSVEHRHYLYFLKSLQNVLNEH